ncbi:MAG: glycosyltransferase [Thermomicrobiales bacterium]
MAVAEAFARRVPDASGLLLTASSSTGDFQLPESLDYVRIPGIDKQELFEDEGDDAADLFAMRKALISTTLSTFAPEMVVVDHNPAGLAGELLPVLNRYRAAISRPLLVLGMRDITYGQEETRAEWEMDNAYDLLEHVYDLILVYGCRDVFDPVVEYALAPEIEAKMIFTGYLQRPEPKTPAHEVRRSLRAGNLPLAVVSAGSGADGAPLIEAFLQAMRRGLLPDMVASVTLGPQMPAADVARLRALARSLQTVTCVRFRNDLESHVAAADVVLSMGGYNSVLEAVGAKKRPIVTPRQAGSREQLLRAKRFARLGLVTVVPREDLTPQHLAGAIKAELAGGVPPSASLDFDGLDRAGLALAMLVGR